MELRRARPDDLGFLMRVEEECFGGERFTREEVLALMGMEGVTLLVADGIGSVGHAIAEGRSRLITIAVLPSQRGRGHARAMLLRAVGDARSAGCASMTLEVSILNLEAVDLYLKSGFRIDGVIPDYYGDGRDAFHMSLRL